MSNLLHNAARYTPAPGRIEAVAEERGGEVVLRVRDSGRGIAPDLLPHVFEPFHQGGRSEGGEQGLGLGLTLVRRLVELHGGQVAAASAGPGMGSEFVVRLPSSTEVLLCRPADVDAASGEAAALRVLVVDDNPDVAESMAELLDFSGHDVRVETDAEVALQTCLEDPPDVALLDIGMPKMTGHELAQEIRRLLPPGARTRLIAVSGHGQPEDLERSREVGFDLHLVKPVEPAELHRALGAVGAGAWGGSQAAARALADA